MGIVHSYCRLDVPDFVQNPFDWSQDPNSIHHTHINEIIPIHQSILHFIGQWLETYPDDFKNNPSLKVSTCIYIVEGLTV